MCANPENNGPQESDFALSNHDFYYRTWMRLGHPGTFEEWMEKRTLLYLSIIPETIASAIINAKVPPTSRAIAVSGFTSR